MRNSRNEPPLKLRIVAIGTIGVAAGTVLGIMAAGGIPRQAAALPVYSEQTKLACQQCHVNPAGGTELTELGKKFQANGHKLPQ